MNNYEKLTLEKFKVNLEGGKYQNLTGARRAIGKADWKEPERDKARGFADKHFGGAPTTKKAVVKVAAPKKEKAAPKGKPGPKKVVRTEEATQADRGFAGLLNKDFNKLQNLQISTQVIGAAAAAIEAMSRAKDVDNSIDISEMQGAVNIIASAVQKMGAIVGKPAAVVAPAPAVEVEHTNGVGANTPAPRQEGLFDQIQD